MKPKRQFWGGFFSGMAVCFTAVVIYMLANVAMTAGRQYGVIGTEGESSTQAESTGSPEAESPVTTALEKIETIQNLIDYYYIFDYNEQDVADKLLKGYVSGLGDVYSAYFTEQEVKEMNESFQGSFVGIGATCSPDALGASVVNVYPDSPAEKAGVLAGDVIIGADGESFAGQDLDTIVSKIRGEKDTAVTLKIKRGEEIIEVTAVRDNIEVKVVSYKMLDDITGYLYLSYFDNLSGKQVRAALEDMKSQGMSKLILDIRNNPGGLLTSVIEITDMFINKDEVILRTVNKQGNGDEYKSSNAPIFDGEMLVIVNGESASAAEVLASSLQDNGRAKLVGKTTFGKGIVQSYFPLGDGTTLKITTENYYTAGGKDIHKVGITPDYDVELEEGKPDTQLQKALDLFGCKAEIESDK